MQCIVGEKVTQKLNVLTNEAVFKKLGLKVREQIFLDGLQKLLIEANLN